MNWTFDALMQGAQRRILDATQGKLRLSWNKPRLWIQTGAITVGLMTTADGKVRFDTLANVKPKTEGCNVNLFERAEQGPAIGSETLRLDSIRWTVRTQGEGLLQTREAKLQLYLKDQLGQADKTLLILSLRFTEGEPVVEVQRDLPRAQTLVDVLGAKEAEAAAQLGVTFPLTNIHYVLHAYTLSDKTDQHDHPVRAYTTHLNPRMPEEVEGQIFYLENRVSGQTLLFAAETPTAEGLRAGQEGPTFAWRPSRVAEGQPPHPLLTIRGRRLDTDVPEAVTGDRLVIAVGDDQILRGYRNYLRRQLFRRSDQGFAPEQAHYMMSNTWGDRNRDMRVSEAFISGEIRAAHRLGIDIVQIDDGWQLGRSMNSGDANAPAITEGFYALDPNYWTVDPERFPNGLAALSQEAQDLGLELGLWFTPDPYEEFVNWERDAETVLGLHRETGIRWYKIDFVHIRSGLGERNYKRFLKRLMDAGLRFSLDVTAQERLGLVHEPAWGTLFLENRYTDFGNYYPHATLRNLWRLAQILPAERLQMEFLNPRRNVDLYDADPYGPANYGIDYLFYSVAAANPLFWMELQSLTEADQETLARAIAVYREVRPELRELYVEPVGACPDGSAMTGFAFTTREGLIRYLLVFKESGEKGAYEWHLPGLAQHVRIEILASNTHHRATPEIAFKPARFGEEDQVLIRGNLGDEPYRYAFYKLAPLG